MAQILYDANGNPILDPSQTTTANNKLPPEAPGGMGGNQQTNQQQTNQQGTQTATAQQTPQNLANTTGTPTGVSGNNLQGLLRLFGQGQTNPALTSAATNPALTQQAALAQGLQVGPPNPPAAQNTNQIGTVATGPTQSQQNTSSAIGSIGSGLSQLGENIAKSVPSWKMMPSAIPDPSQFRSQEQQYQYDFQRHQIV